ncbi:GSU2403 family nucleotidyltransferase fold protein [Bradyrhizobium sp. DASA03068]|uniref:GSU2403 family nucleotidyltransferase fold protein n=1 Tax=Bradyrhizobium sp. BLXBL-01 TaxID=3395915 RepID=UPI003F6F028B
MEGLVVNELARAGLFRLRATLVGSMTYRTYSGVVGLKLPDELVTTEDMDIAILGHLDLDR